MHQQIRTSQTVKQAVLRDASTVRTLNVDTAHRDDVVMIVYNEQSHMLNAYLVSVGDKLRRAISYQAAGK